MSQLLRLVLQRLDLLSQLGLRLLALSLRCDLLQLERRRAGFPLVRLEIGAKLVELSGGGAELRAERSGFGVDHVVELDGELDVGEVHADSVEKKPFEQGGFYGVRREEGEEPKDPTDLTLSWQ